MCTGGGGFWGTIACGIFAAALVGGISGLLEGNAYLFGVQILDTVVTAAFTFGVTYFLAWIVDKTIGLRVTEDEEYIGLDLTQYGEMVTGLAHKLCASQKICVQIGEFMCK